MNLKYLLRVTGRRFVAGAVFTRLPGTKRLRGQFVWHISPWAPILRWMPGLPMVEINRRLKAMGYTHEWIKL